MRTKPLVAALGILIAPLSASAQSGSLEVDARSNLFLSGGNGIGGPYLLDGMFPAFVRLSSGRNRVATFGATGS